MSVRVLEQTKVVLHELNLTQKGQNQVERCVSRYTAPRTFSQGLSFIVHRIVNAVKAVFGRSDWQIASRTLRTVMLTKVDIFDRFDKISAKLPGLLYKPVVKLLKRAAGELGYIMGDTCLKMLILTNEKGTKSELKEMKQAGERELKSVMVKAKKDFFDLARESNVKLNAEQRFLIKKFFA